MRTHAPKNTSDKRNPKEVYRLYRKILALMRKQGAMESHAADKAAQAAVKVVKKTLKYRHMSREIETLWEIRTEEDAKPYE